MLICQQPANMAQNLLHLDEIGIEEVRIKMERLLSSPITVKRDRHTDCLLWKGGVSGASKHRTEGRYPKIRFSSKSKRFKSFICGGHIVQYFLKTRQVPDDRKAEMGDKSRMTGVSHLCHRSLCLNSSHLVMESVRENNCRKPCNKTSGQKKECKNESHCPECYSGRLDL